MRFPITALIATVLYLPASAQPGWKDCATAQKYRAQENGEWKEHTGEVKLCYDTHAFTLTMPQHHLYTGIVQYRQHLEDGYIVEEFYSEEKPQYPNSEFRFHIIRSTPAIITITRIPTGQVYQLQSKELREVKIE
jgi:hypothetical protein